MNEQYIENLIKISDKIPEYMIGDEYTLTLSPGEMIALSQMTSKEIDGIEEVVVSERKFRRKYEEVKSKYDRIMDLISKIGEVDLK